MRAVLALVAVAACDTPVVALPEPVEGATLWLSETGLYRDIGRREVAPDVLEVEPAYALWSDNLVKRRWLRLPAGTRIDTADMDHWQFPAGTMLFKEFAAGGRRIETRLIARTGSGPRDFWMGAFVWNDDESDARFVPGGELDARGTSHDVPAARQCATCHNGEPGRVLGLSAVQQPELPGELLTEPMPAFTPPGDPVTAAALGTLHANCGHCHNPGGSARPDTAMDLRLSVADRRPEQTGAYRTAVDQPVQSDPSHGRRRIAPGAPDDSVVLIRMTARGTRWQMPPIGSEQVDEAGVELVRAWIEML